MRVNVSRVQSIFMEVQAFFFFLILFFFKFDHIVSLLSAAAAVRFLLSLVFSYNCPAAPLASGLFIANVQ